MKTFFKWVDNRTGIAGLTREVLFESVPQLFVQAANAWLIGSWSTTVVVSITFQYPVNPLGIRKASPARNSDTSPLSEISCTRPETMVQNSSRSVKAFHLPGVLVQVPARRVPSGLA